MKKQDAWLAALLAAVMVALVQAGRKAWQKYTYRGRFHSARKELYKTEKKIRQHPWYVDPVQAAAIQAVDDGTMDNSGWKMLHEIDNDTLEESRLNYIHALAQLEEKRAERKASRQQKLAESKAKLKLRKSDDGKDADPGTGTTQTDAA